MGDFHVADRASPAAHPSAARRAAAPLRCAAPAGRERQERSRDPEYRLDDPSCRWPSADPKTSRVRARPPLHWHCLGNARTAKRRAERRLSAANGPFQPVQCAPVRQMPLDGVSGMGPSPRSKPSARKRSATSEASHVGDRSSAWRGPRDDAPRISTRAPRSPVTAPPGRWQRPPKQGPTRATAGCSRPCLRARDALRSRHLRQ